MSMAISFQIQFAKLNILSTEYPFCSCFIILEQSNFLSARLYDLPCHPVLNDGYKTTLIIINMNLTKTLPVLCYLLLPPTSLTERLETDRWVCFTGYLARY